MFSILGFFPFRHFRSSFLSFGVSSSQEYCYAAERQEYAANNIFTNYLQAVAVAGNRSSEVWVVRAQTRKLRRRRALDGSDDGIQGSWTSQYHDLSFVFLVVLGGDW